MQAGVSIGSAVQWQQAEVEVLGSKVKSVQAEFKGWSGQARMVPDMHT